MEITHIFVPKTPDILDRFLNDHGAPTNDETDFLEYTISRNECDGLLLSGVFRKINEACDVFIGGYEEDWVIGIEKLEKCRKALQDFKENPQWPKRFKHLRLQAHLDQIIVLTEEAIARDTGIFFYL